MSQSLHGMRSQSRGSQQETARCIAAADCRLGGCTLVQSALIAARISNYGCHRRADGPQEKYCCCIREILLLHLYGSHPLRYDAPLLSLKLTFSAPQWEFVRHGMNTHTSVDFNFLHTCCHFFVRQLQLIWFDTYLIWSQCVIWEPEYSHKHWQTHMRRPI